LKKIASEKEMEIKMLRLENDKLQERFLDQRIENKKETT
jgi:regulator of replication initiation timing